VLIVVPIVVASELADDDVDVVDEGGGGSAPFPAIFSPKILSMEKLSDEDFFPFEFV